jgi:hypothetical protein
LRRTALSFCYNRAAPDVQAVQKATTNSPIGAKVTPKRSLRFIGMCTSRKRRSNRSFIMLSHWRLLIVDDRLPDQSVSPSVARLFMSQPIPSEPRAVTRMVGYEPEKRRWTRDFMIVPGVRISSSKILNFFTHQTYPSAASLVDFQWYFH